jgi:hypothetical protein
MRVVLALLAACTDPGGGDSEVEKTCVGSLLDADAMAVTISPDIATIATLDLTVDGPADVTITLTADGAPDVEPPTFTGLDGAVSLPIYGLRPDSTYSARVVAETDEDCAEESVDIATGSLPASLPAVSLVTPGDSWGTYTLTGWIDNEDYNNTGALILDEGGVAVWFWIAPLGVAAHASWAIDGSDILVRSDDRTTPGQAAVYRVSMAGELIEQLTVPHAHHNLGQAPDLSFAYLRAVSREIDGEAVTGDEIVERSLDGTERVVWNAFDCLPGIVPHDAWAVETAPIPGRDWTHTNGLSYCAADDTWLISTYYLHEIHKIRRSDCSSAWVLDGDGSIGRGYALADTEDFGPQHAAVCSDDGLVLFDNRHGDGEISRGLALDMDEATETATVRWSVPHPGGLQTGLLGATSLLPDGSTLFGWGAIGEITVSDATGAVEWRLGIDHTTIGSVDRREGLYGP